ncbi:hypothetical protein [Actinomadura sp. 3N407]|uniref:hypothetical protein n=1 Tax=Actinomadura sp. 3N407 TaxID=3457423 RepID=UPI003FCEAE3F
MEHRRPGDRTPGTDGGLSADERARAAGTADRGVAGDTHVAGPAPGPPAMDPPVPDTAPDPIPAVGGDRGEAATAFPNPSPAGTPKTPATPGTPGTPGTPAKLLDPAESERFRERWREVQSAFVDDPGRSVRKADDLASEAVDALGHAIAEHRRALSEELKNQERADTERLRLALRGYRDLLDRIFAA